jgi:hypothetical protein
MNVPFAGNRHFEGFCKKKKGRAVARASHRRASRDVKKPAISGLEELDVGSYAAHVTAIHMQELSLFFSS